MIRRPYPSLARLRSIHRWVGFVCLLFWFVQAASGVFLVFHREIDGWSLGDNDPPLDLTALDERIATITAERGANATSIFSSTGYSNHFDVHLEDDATGAVAVARVDGQGRILRERALEAPVWDGGIYLAANRLHRHLLAGPAGAWIVGVSGVLLLSNIVVGLTLAWPAGSRWRGALMPRRTRSAPAALYTWHRALGLWIAPLALITISCGVLLAFEDGTARLLGATRKMPAGNQRSAETSISTAQAVEEAQRHYPGATFTGLTMPSTARPLYSVFLRQRSEPNQAYGATRVFVAATGGKVIGTFDPLREGIAVRFMSMLFPLHTGQIGGWPGRIAVLAVGLWLIGMLALGAGLGWARHRQAVQRSAPNSATGRKHAP